jgi:hypothetical protein
VRGHGNDMPCIETLARERAWRPDQGGQGTHGALLMGMGKGGTHFWLADG